MCVDKTSVDPCSCCPKIIVVEADEVDEIVSVSDSLHQTVKDFQSQYLMPRVPVPKRVKSIPVTVGVRF